MHSCLTAHIMTQRVNYLLGCHAYPPGLVQRDEAWRFDWSCSRRQDFHLLWKIYHLWIFPDLNRSHTQQMKPDFLHCHHNYHCALYNCYRYCWSQTDLSIPREHGWYNWLHRTLWIFLSKWQHSFRAIPHLPVCQKFPWGNSSCLKTLVRTYCTTLYLWRRHLPCLDVFEHVPVPQIVKQKSLWLGQDFLQMYGPM